ncbi:hypothetical protein [Zhongshania sp.]|uniref:hypothetical protein n=1 Tax=Zhongshania sp. TaxID=1971902 RepID=UPI003563E57A
MRLPLVIVIDTECYKDYWLLSAKHLPTGRVKHFELYDDHPLTRGVSGTLSNYTSISFNGNGYDLPMIAAACRGYNNKQLKALSDQLITGKAPAWKVCRERELEIPASWDHIDLIEVAPGQSSLKIYGGRLGAPTIQDLPLPPDASINAKCRELLKSYCVNDLDTTALLYENLKSQISLREDMGYQYGMDLRSKSDAQIAENVIKSELSALTGKQYRPAKIGKDPKFRYKDPKIIRFQTPELRDVFKRILETRFTMSPTGSVMLPDWLKENKISIGRSQYQMGIGGLHSCEKSQCVRAGDNILCDMDVASYYPNIILQQGLAPESLGEPFLRVYESIVKRRIKAKREGDSITADTLKIAVNGSFGKLGSKYSALYSPDLLIQTTITGQLALLMLIERLELAGISVVSANTDGVVSYCDKSKGPELEAIAFDWMLDTTYELERQDYRVLASRDVNNYVAVTTDGKIKSKGVFAPTGLMKNPDSVIVYEAVSQQIATGKDAQQTIKECRDILKFVTVRTVKGGAKWRDDLLGKAVRFYYSTSVAEDECIHYAANGNRVPKSAGARPLMSLPAEFPKDVDYKAYFVMAEKLLCEVGYYA